jgi:threonine synthase
MMKDLRMTAVLHPESTAPGGVRAGAFGNATHLICRACGQESPLGPFYACLECFGPLEVGYAYPTITREQLQAGPPSIWRYAPLLPVPADIGTFPSTDPGFTGWSTPATSRVISVCVSSG